MHIIKTKSNEIHIFKNVYTQEKTISIVNTSNSILNNSISINFDLNYIVKFCQKNQVTLYHIVHTETRPIANLKILYSIVNMK